MINNIKKNLADLLQEIQACEKKFARTPHCVSLLAVSKYQPIEKIKEAIDAGQTAFGENYLQEALTKIAALTDKHLIWHFIGPIQSNKTKKIAEHFAWAQSVSSTQIAKRLNDQRPAHLPPLNICIQVNISQEQNKSGADSADVLALADYCVLLPRLKLRGLMTIPALRNTFEEQVKELHKLHLLYEKLRSKYSSLDTLSMGMSDDLAAAISEGSTMVRVGTKLFGKRQL